MDGPSPSERDPTVRLPSHDHILTPNLPPARLAFFFFTFLLSPQQPSVSVSCAHIPAALHARAVKRDTGEQRGDERSEAPCLKPGFSLMIYERHIRGPAAHRRTPSLLPDTHSVLLGFGFQRGDGQTTGRDSCDRADEEWSAHDVTAPPVGGGVTRVCPRGTRAPDSGEVKADSGGRRTESDRLRRNCKQVASRVSIAVSRQIKSGVSEMEGTVSVWCQRFHKLRLSSGPVPSLVESSS